MARRRPRTAGAHFEQRRVRQAPSVGPAVTTGLSSRDARELAERISDSQQRYRVGGIRLLASGGCGVIVIDGVTGGEHLAEDREHWQRLRAG